MRPNVAKDLYVDLLDFKENLNDRQSINDE